MNCLSIEQLVALALGNPQAKHADEMAAERDHVRHCYACAGALARAEQGMSRVAAAHGWFEQGHEQARARLLAALGSGGAEHRVRPWRNRFRAVKKVVTMRRMLIGGSAVAAIVGLLLVWAATRPPSALAQTAKALREVKSYQCRLTYEVEGADENKDEKEVEVLRWAAPGSYRVESHEGGKPVSVRIAIRGKPGLDIDHKFETYQRLEPLHGPESPLFLLGELANFTGKADRELPARKVKGKAARGFEIPLDKIDPDFGDGTLRVWPDPQTKLPLRLELHMQDVGKMVMEDFAWDVPADQWFDTEPPAKYQDETPTPASPEEQTEHIVKGLKAYARYCGGKYPPVKVVHADVTSGWLFKAAGLSSPQRGPTEEETTRDEYRELAEARQRLEQANRELDAQGKRLPVESQPAAGVQRKEQSAPSTGAASRPARRRRNGLAKRLVWLEALKLILAFAFLVPAWALLGTFLFSARDSGFPAAPGLLAGVALGVFFGLAFGGTMRWRVWEYIFEPERPRRRRN